jgi:V/A-type H+-transporting ATPase subunit D
LVEDSGEEWERTCAEAESWLLRTALLGGQRAVLAGSRDRADTARVQLRWQNTAGVTYPIEALTQAQEAPPLPVAGNAALAYAADSYGRALEAAIHHAAAAVALRLVEDELTVTRQRLRSVEDRWIPQLKSMLADLDLRLAELEREEIIRLRWAHAQHRGPVGRR